MNEELRKQFEEWYEADAMPSESDWFEMSADGSEYDILNTQISWEGFQACAKIKDAEIEELRKQVTMMIDFIKTAQVESGVCCCGDAMKDHYYNSGHSPVDMWDDAVGHLVEANPSTWFDEQIAKAKADQREKDADICESQDGEHDVIYAEAIRNQC